VGILLDSTTKFVVKKALTIKLAKNEPPKIENIPDEIIVAKRFV
jgi:hypothetical protein